MSATTLPCLDARFGQFAAKLVFATSAPAALVLVIWFIHIVASNFKRQNAAVLLRSYWRSLLVLYLALPSSTTVIFSGAHGVSYTRLGPLPPTPALSPPPFSLRPALSSAQLRPSVPVRR